MVRFRGNSTIGVLFKARVRTRVRARVRAYSKTMDLTPWLGLESDPGLE